jgi:hypothetical protein
MRIEKNLLKLSEKTGVEGLTDTVAFVQETINKDNDTDSDFIINNAEIINETDERLLFKCDINSKPFVVEILSRIKDKTAETRIKDFLLNNVISIVFKEGEPQEGIPLHIFESNNGVYIKKIYIFPCFHK